MEYVRSFNFTKERTSSRCRRSNTREHRDLPAFAALRASGTAALTGGLDSHLMAVSSRMFLWPNFQQALSRRSNRGYCLSWLINAASYSSAVVMDRRFCTAWSEKPLAWRCACSCSPHGSFRFDLDADPAGVLLSIHPPSRHLHWPAASVTIKVMDGVHI